MANEDGTCALCSQPLTDHQVLVDRRIERMEYIPLGHSDFQAMAIVLYCEDLANYCSTDSAGVQKELQDRGINKAGTSIGPMTRCAKCGSFVDMIQPHAHYVMMEVDVNKTSEQTIMTAT